VESGGTSLITRQEHAIARIVPEVDRRHEESESAIEGIKALRKRAGKITLAELQSARNERRK
jgi:antitoxin (DNA-binding transcriptional repressor) of toxin-antitoxin stability system